MVPELWAEAAKIVGIPYIWHIRGFQDLDHHSTFMNKRHSYGLIRQANHVIAISKSVQHYWENRLNKKIDLIYNGLPVKEYYSEHVWNPKQQELKCLMVGRIKETKGQMDAIKAIENLKKRGIYNISLTLVGYRGVDEYELKLADYIRDHQLEQNVELVDYTYDMKQIRDNHVVGLTCSKAEAFGRVTVEYIRRMPVYS